jgi:hypothetical protein
MQNVIEPGLAMAAVSVGFSSGLRCDGGEMHLQVLIYRKYLSGGGGVWLSGEICRRS